MHYERTPASEYRSPDEAPPALRCAGLRSATAALESRGWFRAVPLGKSAGEWHFTLRERQALARMIFPPKEATQMSHDVKYIGMDVHKEAIVIVVLNESGKLVMESVIETKASSILQFLHGLRGELHVTWCTED
jgi:hypothetical protein